ncbi:flagellar filament capping protein FliD [Halomonas daqingensis]|uniref:Flagellar hook-associated protein 2 n=1 Tax=Billgrantia desiderata TaxID=52021 RepID=A0ABS9AZD6_9GAMM|nr:flagellar filament capping protein FliD [Halomonas desiderata]MCE8040551.1 flagellar filament capping protein FliD [Halomonas desiderata]MCE8045126.1 flagellar filament capping protein FliD [Halomonas desiderata]
MASISSLGIGSGLDLNGLLDQLYAAERSKLEPIGQQIETQQVKISAYGELKGALSAFQDATQALNETTLYQSLSTSISGDAVQAAANGEASPGRYDISVDTLATAGSIATQRVDSLDTVLTEDDSELNLTFANADLNQRVAIEAGSTLQDVRDAINADPEAAVNASVINDGSGYRLALMSKQTGSDATLLDTDFAEMASDATLTDVTIEQAGQNAAFTVNGISVESASNQVDDAIQGVALDLQSTGQSSLLVEQDTQPAREGIDNFISAYNELKSTAGRLTAFNGADGQAGELIGDSAVRTIESRLRSDLGNGLVGEEGHQRLDEIGIALAVDGRLELDEQKLDAALAENPEAVGAFFSGADEANGLAGRLDATLSQLLDEEGALESAVAGAENRIESLGDRYVRMEQRIDTSIAHYQTQFSQLDAMMAQMNQTSAYLTQQLGMLDAQMGGGGMSGQ